MMTVHGSGARTLERYLDIFRQADSRFQLLGQRSGKDGVFHSILHFVFKE